MDSTFLEGIKKNSGVEWLSFCFTDISGALRRLTYNINTISGNSVERGVRVEAASILGSDDVALYSVLLLPDVASVFADPFTSQESLCVMCGIKDALSGKVLEIDSRSIALRAADSLNSALGKIELETDIQFSIFDCVDYKISPCEVYHKVSSDEIVGAETGHKLGMGAGYGASSPCDRLFDIRSEICTAMKSVGVSPMSHHHEVDSAQCEVRIKRYSFIEGADNIQKSKYVIKSVVSSFGKSATFMPNTVHKGSGSKMRIRFSIPTSEARDMNLASQEVLYFTGGIIKHYKVLNAFTNGTTNSYKRVEEQKHCDIRITSGLEGRSTVEVSFIDSISNPYLALAALTMSGLDGIKNKIDISEMLDGNSCWYAKQEGCKSLGEALDVLDANRGFLKKNNVFTDELIDAYIKLKSQEIDHVMNAVNPMEFFLYYSM